jgi:hypothetical protein
MKEVPMSADHKVLVEVDSVLILGDPHGVLGQQL